MLSPVLHIIISFSAYVKLEITNNFFSSSAMNWDKAELSRSHNSPCIQTLLFGTQCVIPFAQSHISLCLVWYAHALPYVQGAPRSRAYRIHSTQCNYNILLHTPSTPVLVQDATNFSVFSKNATAMELCLFSETDLQSGRVTQSIKLESELNKTGDLWHIEVPNLDPQLLYGKFSTWSTIIAIGTSGIVIENVSFVLVQSMGEEHPRKEACISSVFKESSTACMLKLVSDPESRLMSLVSRERGKACA